MRFMKLATIILVTIGLLALTGAVFADQKKLTGKLEIFSWWAGDEGPAHRGEPRRRDRV